MFAAQVHGGGAIGFFTVRTFDTAQEARTWLKSTTYGLRTNRVITVAQAGAEEALREAFYAKAYDY